MRTFTLNSPCFEESRDAVDSDVFPPNNPYYGSAYKDRDDWLRWGPGPEDDGVTYAEDAVWELHVMILDELNANVCKRVPISDAFRSQKDHDEWHSIGLPPKTGIWGADPSYDAAQELDK